MTRISTKLIAFLLLTQISIPCFGLEQKGNLSTDSLIEQEYGISAQYCINYSIPSMEQAGAVYVTYLVLDDEWLAYISYSLPGFINAVISPPALTTSIHCQNNQVTFHSPYNNTHDVIDVSPDTKRIRYNSQSYDLKQTAFAPRETELWRIPDSITNLIGDSDLHEPKITLPYSPRSGTRTYKGQIHLTSSDGMVSTLTIQPTQDWRRDYTGFQWLTTNRGQQIVSSQCVMTSKRHLLHVLNQFDLPRVPGDHDQATDPWLVYHRGGRHVQTSWTVVDDVAVPDIITVTLGPTGSGMLLRKARMISSQLRPASEIRQHINRLIQLKHEETIAPQFARIIARRFWKKRPNDLSEQSHSLADRMITNQIGFLNKKPSNGERVALNNNLVKLTAASDETPDLAEFRHHLQNFLTIVGVDGGPELQVSSLFNFLEMVRKWHRADLEDIGREHLSKILSALPVRDQFRVLYFTESPTETKDIYANELINSLRQALDDDEIPETEIRAGLIVASLRLEQIYRNSLLSRFRKTEADNARYDRLEQELLDAYREMLVHMSQSESPNLQHSASRLQGLADELELTIRQPEEK